MDATEAWTVVILGGALGYFLLWVVIRAAITSALDQRDREQAARERPPAAAVMLAIGSYGAGWGQLAVVAVVAMVLFGGIFLAVRAAIRSANKRPK